MDNSLWIASMQGTTKRYESLQEDVNSDVCIIGGGLTGLTSAYYLSKARQKSSCIRKKLYRKSHKSVILLEKLLVSMVFFMTI